MLIRFIFLHFLSVHLIIKFLKNKPSIISDICKSIRKKPNLSSEENKVEIDNEYLKHFDKVLKTHININNLKLYNNNVKTLKIEKKRLIKENLFRKSTVEGYYEHNKNKVIIDKNALVQNVINHELFHMASSANYKKFVYSGFAQHQSKKSFCILFNEGYTDLLSKRYFDTEPYYIFETLIVEQIENIIGKEKMEECYFNADLYSLIEEMKKYVTEEDINIFFNNLDFYMDYLMEKNYAEAALILTKIINFIYTIYNNKLDYDLEHHIINEFIYKDERIIMLLNLKSLITKLKINNFLGKNTSYEDILVNNLKKINNVNIMYFH